MSDSSDRSGQSDAEDTHEGEQVKARDGDDSLNRRDISNSQESEAKYMEDHDNEDHEEEEEEEDEDEDEKEMWAQAEEFLQQVELLTAPRRLAMFSEDHENLMNVYFTTTRWKSLLGERTSSSGGGGLYKLPKELGLLLSLLLNQYVDFSPEYQSANDYRKFKTPVAMVVRFWKALLWMTYSGSQSKAEKIETDYYQQKYQRSVMRPMTEDEWEERRSCREEQGFLPSWSDGDGEYDEDLVSEVSTLESHIPEYEDHVAALAHLGYMLPDPSSSIVSFNLGNWDKQADATEVQTEDIIDVDGDYIWEEEEGLSHLRRSFRKNSTNYLSTQMAIFSDPLKFEYKWLQTICSAGQADCLHYALERTQYPLEMLWDMDLRHFLITTGMLSALARRNGGSIDGIPCKGKHLAQILFLFPSSQKISMGFRVEEKRTGEVTEALIALGGVLTLEEVFSQCTVLLERGDVKAADKLFSVVQRTSRGGTPALLDFSPKQKSQLCSTVKSLECFQHVERLLGAADDILLPGEPSSEIRWPPQFLISGDWRILWYVLQEYGTKDQRIKSALVSAVDPSTKCTLLELQLVSSSTVSFNRVAILLNAGATLSHSSFKHLMTTMLDHFFSLDGYRLPSIVCRPHDDLFSLILQTHRHFLDQELLQTLASSAIRLRVLKLLELVASLGLEGKTSHLAEIADNWCRVSTQRSDANEYLRREAKILIGCGAIPTQSAVDRIQKKPGAPLLRDFVKMCPRSTARPIIRKSKIVVVLVKEGEGADSSSHATLRYYLTDSDGGEKSSVPNSAPDSFARQKRGREDEQQTNIAEVTLKSSPEVIDVDEL